MPRRVSDMAASLQSRTAKTRPRLLSSLLQKLEERITPVITTWIPTAAGSYSWNTAANWSNGVPSNPGDVADVNIALAGAQTITVNSNSTLGTLNLGDANAVYPLTIAPYGGTLTFSVTTGSAAINDSSAAGDVINDSLVLASSLKITESNALTLGGFLSGSGSLSAAGAGSVLLSGNNSYSGGTTISSGSVIAPSNVALGTGSVTQAGGNLTLSAGRAMNGPLSLSGYTGDIVWALGESSSATGTNTTLDGIYALYEAGVNTANPTVGLPVSRTFVSTSGSGTTFTLAPYTADNVVINNGTLSLAAPSSFKTLSFLTSAGNGNANYKATLNFSNGTSTTISALTAPDWFNNTPYALEGFDRVVASSGAFANAGNDPRFYEQDYTLSSTDAAKTLVSVTFAQTGGGTLGVFAISGTGSAPAAAPGNLTIPAGDTATQNVLASPTSSSVTAGTLSLGAGSTLNIGAAITINGFNGSGTNWILNTVNTGNPASIANNVLTITTAVNGEANSAWYNQPVYTGGNWTANFQYTDLTTTNPADGSTFTLQNYSGGLASLGAGGGGLGYNGITNSVAIELNVFAASTVGISIETNGTIANPFTTTGSVNLASGVPVLVSLSYNTATTTLSVTLTQGSNTFTTSASVNVASIVGSTGFIGFTGGTGGLAALQEITGFSFNTATLSSEPALSFTAGQTNLSGTDTINVNNSAFGSGTATLGTLNDSGTAATLKVGGSGTLTLASAATSLVAGTVVDVNSGTLQLGNASALGTHASISIASGATLTGFGTFTTVNDSGTLIPGLSGGEGIINTGALTFTSSGAFDTPLNSNVAGTGYSQIVASGQITLANAALNLTPALTGLVTGEQFTLIKNNSGLAISGTFAGLPEGATITFASSQFKITYLGGTSGHDVVLTVTGGSYYVDSAWAGYTYGQAIPDADPVAPGNQTAIYGQSAFSSVDAAIAASTITGQVIVVNAGSFSEDVLINKPVKLILQQGAISFGSLGDTISTATITLNGIALTVGGDNNSTSLATSISGTGSLIKAGTGSMTLTGADIYTGGTTVSAGKLIDGGASSFPNVTILTVAAGGDYRLSGNSITVSSLTGGGTVEDAASGNVTLTVGDSTNNFNSTFTGILQNGIGGGTLALVKAGTGTLIVGGTTASTFTGGTTVSGGSLAVNATGAVGQNGTSDGTVSLASGTSLVFTSSGKVTYSGAVTGTGALIVQGGGSLTLSSGASVTLPSVTVGTGGGAGTLAISTGASLTDSGALTLGSVTGDGGTVNQSGGTVSLTSTSGTGASSVLVIGSASGETSAYKISGGSVTSSASTITVGGSGTGQFTESGGTASVLGLWLGGLTGSTGSLTLTGGLLTVYSSSISEGAGTASQTFGGGTLQAGATISDSIPAALTTATNTNIDTQTFTLTFSNTIAGAGALTKISSGTLLLSSTSNSYSGGTTISAGTVQAPYKLSLGTGKVVQAGGLLSLYTNTSTEPVTLTGYNADAVWAVGQGTAPPATVIGFDGNGGANGNCFYEAGVPGATQGGLPASGTFTSAANPTVNFTLAPYGGDDVLFFTTVGSSNTLTLAAPGDFQSLNLLDSAANGVATFSFTLNFSDGSNTTVGGQTAPDWYGGANYAIEGIDRYTIGGTFDYGGETTNPRLYEADYTLPLADQSKTLDSVTFNYTSGTGGGTTLGIFAISGTEDSATAYPNNVVVPAGDTATTSLLTAGDVTTTSMGTLTAGNGSTLNLAINPSELPLTSLSGFGGDGTGWTLNGVASIAGNDLTTTTDAGGEANSAWYNQQVYVGSPLSVSFTYTDTSGAGADGTCFVLQDVGLNAVGGGGGELGYAGLGSPSIALAMNIYDGHNIGYSLLTDQPGGDIDNYTVASNSDGTSINFASGTPVNVTLAYDGNSTITLTLVQAGASTYTTTFTGYNLENILGSSTAYIGFTGGTGSAMAQQDVTNFSYSATAPAVSGYGFTYGQTNIAGTDTINVAGSSTVPGTLTLGGINDAGTAATLNLNGGTIIANGAAVSLVAGSAINLESGTLISDNATALGSAAVTVASGTTLEGSGTTGTLTVNGTLTPGINGPAIFTSSGGLTFGTNAVYNVDINGTTAGSTYTEVISNGPVNLNGATLNMSLGYTPNPGDTYTLIKNNSGTPVQGTFAGLPNGSLLTLGGVLFTLNYEGGSGFDVVLTQAVGTSIDMGSSDNAAVYGETVEFVADILAGGNEAAVGNITFFDGNTVLATVVVGADGNSGEGTFSTSSLVIGTHTITATYNPTPNSGFLGTSASIQQSVVQDAANVALNSSENPSNFGDLVTFSAVVSPAGIGSGVPTGTVTFYDRTAPLMTEPLTSGTASYATSSLVVGTHQITAVYNGDSNFLGGTSQAVSQVVDGTSAPGITGVLINNNQLQDSMVTTIQVSFSALLNTTLLQSAFSLTQTGKPNSQPGDGATIGTITVSASTNASGDTVATLTFSGANTEGGSLADGIWMLNIDHTKVVSGGVEMAANYTQGNIKRLFGDYDGSGDVDSTDLGVLGTTYGLFSTSPAFLAAFDSDGNGVIDSTDLQRFGSNFGLSI